jgi:hypothetical protein
VYRIDPYGKAVLYRIHPCIRPRRDSLRLCTSVVLPICQRVGRYLEHQGLLLRDAECDSLEREAPEPSDVMAQLLGSSISYLLAALVPRPRVDLTRITGFCPPITAGAAWSRRHDAPREPNASRTHTTEHPPNAMSR